MIMSTAISSVLFKAGKFTSVIIVGVLLSTPRGLAAPLSLEQNDPSFSNSSFTQLDEGVDQVTSVSQLSDVKPTDWAFQALQSLVERYGCIAGYPDRTYRGNRALTRYEFAAGINACLDRVNELIAAGTAELVKKDDLVVLQTMQEQFAAELATLRGRVDSLEARTNTLQAQLFSPTTRLNVLSSFNLSQAFASGDVKAEGIPIPNALPAARFALRSPNPTTGRLEPIVTRTTRSPSATLSQSTYLILSSSFTGRDVLTTVLAAGNGSPPASVYSSAGFSSTFGVPYADSNPVNPLAPNSIGLFELKYQFPIGDSVSAIVGPRILPFRHFDTNPYTNVVNAASGLNSYQSTLANGGLSGAGAIVNWKINPKLVFQAGYLNRNDASLQYFGGDGAPNPQRGIFKGSYSILAELAYSPSPQATFRFLYTRSHSQAPPPTSSPFQPSFPFFLTNSIRGVVDDGFGGGLEDIDADNFVFNFDWTISPKFALFGRYSYSRSNLDPVNPLLQSGSVKVQAFQLGVALPDLGRRGALGTLSFVVPFDIVSGRQFFVAGNGDGGTEFDVEATYAYPINRNIMIVPTFFATFNANNFKDNPTVFGTVLRTQFLF
jgi:hypothetical protein